nr:class I SAM-dependent methyltransferase [Oceanococcus sp. HetDA_MAG_MS8]
MVKRSLRRFLLRALRPAHCRWLFDAPRGAAVLDIGCGNHSPTRVKSLRPDVHYTGVDVEYFHLNAHDIEMAAEVIILPKDRYASALKQSLDGRTFDLIILQHVLEHVDDPLGVLRVVSECLSTNGVIYASFPTKASVHFPSAEGTLNFYDDPTHRHVISAAEVYRELEQAHLTPESVHLRYRHPVYACLGLAHWVIQLPRRLCGGAMRVNSFIWSLYGFETIIVFRRYASESV